MTTHDKDKIIAAAKEAGFAEWENTDSPEFLALIAEFYTIAFAAGAASRDAEIAELKDAAQAVIDRWDTPIWKDVPATGEYINKLRAALAKVRKP